MAVHLIAPPRTRRTRRAPGLSLASLRLLVLGAVSVFAALGAAVVSANVAIVVNAANPVQALSSREVAELYMGRTRTFAGGQYAVVVDQAGEGTLRAQFFKDVTGLSLGQVTAYWSRLKFTGQVQPPLSLDNDAAILDYVRKTPGAIGYVNASSSIDTRLRVVLLLPERASGTP